MSTVNVCNVIGSEPEPDMYVITAVIVVEDEAVNPIVGGAEPVPVKHTVFELATLDPLLAIPQKVKVLSPFKIVISESKITVPYEPVVPLQRL